MPITKLEIPETSSLYGFTFEGNVTYDYHISALQRQLETARNTKAIHVVLDFRQAIFVDKKLLDYLWQFQRKLEQGHKFYFLGDRYKIHNLFEKT